MTDKNELAKALVKFQSEVPVIPKSQTAKIATKTGRDYSYTYADLSDIWLAIRKPLKENGLAVTQMLTSNDSTDFINTKIWHESGETENETFAIPTGGKTPQEVGSVITYYKRYALSSALGISTEEDDDCKSGNKAPEPKPIQGKDQITDEQRAEITKLAKKLDYTDAEIKAKIASIRNDDVAQATLEKLNTLVFEKDM